MATTSDPNLLWHALGDSPNPVSGNCGATDNDFCRTQIMRPDAITVVPNPDPVRGPPKMFRFNINQKDGAYTNPSGVTYSDQRACTSMPGRLHAYPGTEHWWRFFMAVDETFVPRYPKQDQLQQYINDPINGPHLDPGSGWQFHHGYDDNRTEGGSAPCYTGMDEKGPWLKLVDPAINDERVRWSGGSLQTMHAYEFLLHYIHHTDPSKGLVEWWLDGVPIVTGYKTYTMYNGTFNYPIACIYRRWSIGAAFLQDGKTPLVWPADAKPGVKYPALFTPKKGQRVYDDSGMPQSYYMGGFACGKTRDAVVNLYPTIRAGSATVQVPVPPVVPPAPTPAPGGTVATSSAVDVARVNAGLKAMVEARVLLEKTTLPQLDVQIAALNAQVGELQAQVIELQKRRNELQAKLTPLAKALDVGEWGGGIIYTP